ncbi:hypothetical protein ABZW11_07880 [Nonomuraea sp. NPDC004580]|uniref:hypothetical protein n=1 Tax=Nonomuraea sp. NPDC004580 TaxID=3154552 RepID=UPI00339ECE30
MPKISAPKALVTVIGVAAALSVMAPATTASAASAGCRIASGKISTKDGNVSYRLELCTNGFGKASGTVRDTKSDVWTAVVEVSFKKKNGDEIDGGYKEAGRKKGTKDFSFSTSRTNLDRITIRAKRCLPGTIVCNNTKTFTLYP